MRHLTLTSIILVLLLAKIAVRVSADEADPIKDRLDKVRTAYEDNLKQARKNLLTLIQQKEVECQKSGNLNQLKTAQTEREALSLRGEMPTVVSTSEYRFTANKARERLTEALTLARKEYTQEGKLEQAELIDDELKKMKNPNAALPGQVQPPTDQRVLFFHDEGYWLKGEGKDWFEKVDNRPFLWVETNRTPEFIELRALGEGRQNLSMRIFEKQANSKEDQGDWKPARTGHWRVEK